MVALCATSAALIAAAPTTTAFADAAQNAAAGAGGTSHTSGASSATVTADSLPAPGELLAPGRIDELLAALPLGDLSVSRLAHELAALEDVSALAELHVGLLSGETLGAAGLEESLTKAIEQLGPSATIGELVQTSGLLPHVEAELNGLLAKLLGGTLEGKAQQELAEALHTLSLDQLVSSLLATANEPEQLTDLSALASGIFEKLGSNTVEELLGAPLETPFQPTTVEAAASELHTTAQAVSGELGQTASELPASATMLTAAVGKGKLLAVAPALKGLAVGLLGGSPAGEEKGSGSKEGGESKEGGGASEGKGSGTGREAGGQQTGGQGGAGGNATPGGTGGSTGPLTVVVNIPAAATGGAGSGASKATAAKLRILSAKTRGTHATLVLQAPAAGHLQLRGAGVRAQTLTIRKAGRVTVRLSLSKAGVASLRRHHGHTRVELRASFAGANGGRATATVALTFK